MLTSKLALADASVFVNTEAYNFKALVFEMLDRLINARMLDARRHYPSAAPAHGMSRALNGKIVALRSAGGEINLVIPAEEPARHIRARVFEHFVRRDDGLPQSSVTAVFIASTASLHTGVVALLSRYAVIRKITPNRTIPNYTYIFYIIQHNHRTCNIFERIAAILRAASFFLSAHKTPARYII